MSDWYGFPSFGWDNRRDPASIRYNNPGAMYPGPSATAYGSTGYGTIGGGHKIARFDDPESGAAAQFHLLRNRYSGLPLGQAITTWSGGNSSPSYIQSVSKSLGVAPDTPVSSLLSNPTQAVALARAMARYEAGRDYPLTDEQWMNAYNRVPDGGGYAGGTQGRKMPTNSLMDLMSGNAQYADTLGRPSNFNDALASRQMSLMGLGLGLLQPYFPSRGQSPWTNALQGYMSGAQADQSSAQDAWKRGMAERQFAESNMTDFQKMQRDIGRYAGTPMEAEVKRFYAAKMGETPQLVSVEDPNNPGEKLSALFNPRAPSGQQFTDLQGRPLNIGGGGATASPSSAFDQPSAGRVGYGSAGIGEKGFGTGGFGTQPSGQATAQAGPQYRQGPKATEAETNLRKEIDQLPEVKRYVQAVPSLQSMMESSKKGSRAADLDFVYGIAQIFDPNSVVREGEMKLATGTQSLPDDVQGIIRQVALGNSRLSEQARNRLLEVAHTRVGQYRAAYDTRIGNYSGIVQRQRLNPANVMPGVMDMPQLPFSSADEAPTSSPQPPRVQRWGKDAQGNPIPLP